MSVESYIPKNTYLIYILAVGTEEGYVCIFDVVPDGLNFDKILDKQEGRVLTLDWHVDGFHIVTGSTDTIRVWNVESGHPVQRMSTGRAEHNLETTVWSILMLKDFTVVSGDSRGKTSFWNGQNGTLLDSYQSHKADILCVTTTSDEKVVYASGVDPSIAHFQPITKNTRTRWVKSISRYSFTYTVWHPNCLHLCFVFIAKGVTIWVPHSVRCQ